MKAFVVLLCALGVAHAAIDITRGVRISARADEDTSAGTPAAAVACAEGDVGMKCNTCTTTLVCNGATELGNSTCTGNNAFCDPVTNSCVKDKPASCDAAGTDFKCPDEGFFPDPKNCQLYYFCDEAKTAELWECPPKYVYDALKGFCKRQVYTADCVTIKCTAANTFVVHKVNPNFYAFCDSTLTPNLFKCPKNQQFNSGCKYICKSEGYFEGSTKSQAFHCSKSGVNWVQKIYDCPVGYEYNASFNCVKSPAPATPPAK